MTIVEQYWAGIAQRLQIEAGVLHSLIPHAVTKGTENELALARTIERLVPPNIGVGSGVIFDHRGASSAQIDIILYDKGSQPRLLAQTNQVMFPVETVKMAIEVKTTLRGKDVTEDFPRKRQRLADLRALDGYSAPPFALFAYSFADSDYARAKELSSLDAKLRPDIACVISPGFVIDNQRIGFVPVVVNDGNEPSFLNADFDALPSKKIGEAFYPVYMLGQYTGTRYVGDPGRALLLFCISLLSRLGEDSSYNWINAYTSSVIRTLQPIE